MDPLGWFLDTFGCLGFIAILFGMLVALIYFLHLVIPGIVVLIIAIPFLITEFCRWILGYSDNEKKKYRPKK